MILLADLGPLFAFYPSYNAQTVLELLDFLPKNVVYTGIDEENWQNNSWRNQEQPLLFALDGQIDFEPIGFDWYWALEEQKQLFEFLKQFVEGQKRLQKAQSLELSLKNNLIKPLMIGDFYREELWQAIDDYQQGLVELFAEGPGTAHRQKRLDLLAEKLNKLKPEVAIVPLEDLPWLYRNIEAELPELKSFVPGEFSRARALIDRAYQLQESDDFEALVRGLLAIDGSPDTRMGQLGLEARLAAAGIYLAVGDLESAEDLLVSLAGAQLSKPQYLPGFVIVRLGQVRDLLGKRELAVRAYRAALALEWLPSEAKEIALLGLQSPFTLEPTS